MAAAVSSSAPIGSSLGARVAIGSGLVAREDRFHLMSWQLLVYRLCSDTMLSKIKDKILAFPIYQFHAVKHEIFSQ